ncbi:MAG: recombination mediator RecR [Leptospiraceae bacterium]|nr:recombination mediator RecR [Leptospiraceae bacterium]MDW8305791.1 recombination mediator RecR [Leptospiraceae bacterium]
MPEEVQKLASLLANLPGLGMRSAQRIVFYLLRDNKNTIEELISALERLRLNIEYCCDCGSLKSKNEACVFCAPSRDASQMCVVEQPSDIYLIEHTQEYRGLYHVLMGVLSPLDGVYPEHLRLAELKKRVEALPIREIIVATNPSVEGLATANYIGHMLENRPNLKITRLASGLALGSQLEYADRDTLTQALRNRVALNG